MSKLLMIALVVAVTTSACGQSPGGDRSPIDIQERPPVDSSSLQGNNEADQLAREVVDASGGEAWSDRSWNLAFEFVSYRQGKEAARFSHRWNRQTNAAVVSGAGQDGKRWEVRFDDIYARKGTATIDGAPPPDTALPRLLENAYARFINDSYWLLMPLKLLDDGVNRRRLEDTTIGERRYERLHLSFGKVGLTPGDQYWLFIDPETKRVAFWRFLLQSGRTGEYRWEEYEPAGPIILARTRRGADGAVGIRFENVRAGRFPVP